MKTLTDDQLAVAIPTAFRELFPDAMKHDWEYIRHYRDSEIRQGGLFRCRRCYEYLKRQDGTILDDTMICEKVAPIDINDYNVAHKVVRECDAEAIRETLWNTWWSTSTQEGFHDGFDYWLFRIATPADYLRAALEAVKEVE